MNISARGEEASKTELRIDLDLYFAALDNLYDPRLNPAGKFPMNVAENKLCWQLLKEKIAAVTRTNELPNWVAGYCSPAGYIDFRKAVANFLEKYLTKCPIDENLIAASAGATSVVELSTFLIGNPGDVVVFPAPCYPVYKNDIGSIGNLERYDLITHHELSEIRDGSSLSLEHLEQTKTKLLKEEKQFKILVLTNPDNPTGTVYKKEQLEQIANWCIKEKIHLIVNEIYGLSLINTNHSEIKSDYTEGYQFYSFAAIMHNFKSEYLHWWYAFSKDFGISGFRVGLFHTYNEQLMQAYNNLNLSHSVSNYTQWLLQMVLEDHIFLDVFTRATKERITASYIEVVKILRELKIDYVPSRGSLFVWVDFSKFIKEPTEKGENDFWLELYDATGILITPSAGFGHSKKGQFRLVYTFFEKESLKVAMEKLKRFMEELS